MNAEEEQRRRDVEELTSSLRTEPAFRSLRDGLAEIGFDWETAMLAFFAEDEDGDEQGAIVAADGKVFRFTRQRDGVGKWRFSAFDDVTADRRRRDDFREEIEAAVAMAAERQPPARE